MALAVQTVPNVVTRCPFCLASQGLREMCFFTDNGKLSARRRCKRCKKTMSAESAIVFLKGSREYGLWVGAYAWSGFWHKIDHDDYMKQIEFLKEIKQLNTFEFWKAYREVKPKVETEEDRDRRIAKQYEEYESSFEEEATA
jgi:hypothetical protein